MSRSQISSEVSEDVRLQLDRFTRARGLKKGYVLEQALASYMLAVQELPADLIVPARIVVSAESFAAIVAEIEGSPVQTPPMTALLTGDYQSVDDSALA